MDLYSKYQTKSVKKNTRTVKRKLSYDIYDYKDHQAYRIKINLIGSVFNQINILINLFQLLDLNCDSV